MTVTKWIYKNKINYPKKDIRLIHKDKNLVIGNYWLPWSDWEIQNVKITSRWIFVYI